jgi:phospholipid transport system substrate-binding protein
MLRLIKTFGFLSLFLAGSAFAAVAPHDALRQATDQLFTTFKTSHKQVKGDPQRVYALVDNSLGPYVDFPMVSQFVLGKHWRTASEAQRARFITEFHTMLVRFYTSAFVNDPKKVEEVLANSATLISFAPATMNPDGVRATVDAQVHLPDGRTVPVGFSMHNRTGTWKVYDVQVEGISMVTNYRTSFAGEIEKEGLDNFLDRLAARNREFLPQAKAR